MPMHRSRQDHQKQPKQSQNGIITTYIALEYVKLYLKLYFQTYRTLHIFVWLLKEVRVRAACLG